MLKKRAWTCSAKCAVYRLERRDYVVFCVRAEWRVVVTAGSLGVKPFCGRIVMFSFLLCW